MLKASHHSIDQSTGPRAALAAANDRPRRSIKLEYLYTAN
jgi:hypothetical protein